ncbi:MAG: DUF4199 domain-containing protein [Ignavibacteria bacterium]|nr:DUF4199 domain-containing protein [Ignavibacteria bacterium]
MKKYISSFVTGFGAGVLHVVPVAKSLACCLIVPLASFISLLLDRKANPTSEKITMKKGAMFGLVTGLYAALFATVFDLLITLITKNNDIVSMMPELQKMIVAFPLSESLKSEVMRLFESVRNDIINYGFSSLYTFSIIINNTVVNSIVGTIVGLIGAQIINHKLNNSNEY